MCLLYGNTGPALGPESLIQGSLFQNLGRGLREHQNHAISSQSCVGLQEDF